jgi:hypothetical protein
MSIADTRSHAVDQVCTFLRNELGDRAPPRSTVEAALGVYDEHQGAREPKLEEAPGSLVVRTLAEATFAISLPGGGKGTVERLGDTAALDMMARLSDAGVLLMRR